MKTLQSELSKHNFATGQLLDSEVEQFPDIQYHDKLPSAGWLVDSEYETLAKLETWESAVEFWHAAKNDYDFLVIRRYRPTPESHDEECARLRRSRLWNYGHGAF